MSKIKIVIVVLIIGAVLIALSRKFHYVDYKPAVAVAEKFFDGLQQGDVEAVFQSPGARHLDKIDGNWKKVISGLSNRYGAITSRSLVGTSIVPVSDVGCSLLLYEVHRSQLITEERLIVCPSESHSGYYFAGHELRRTDTGQSFLSGLSVQSLGVSTP